MQQEHRGVKQPVIELLAAEGFELDVREPVVERFGVDWRLV